MPRPLVWNGSSSVSRNRASNHDILDNNDIVFFLEKIFIFDFRFVFILCL